MYKRQGDDTGPQQRENKQRAQHACHPGTLTAIGGLCRRRRLRWLRLRGLRLKLCFRLGAVAVIAPEILLPRVGLRGVIAREILPRMRTQRSSTLKLKQSFSHSLKRIDE